MYIRIRKKDNHVLGDLENTKCRTGLAFDRQGERS